MSHVWVVEMRCGRGVLWHPVTAEVSRRQAVADRFWRRRNNPDDHFRVVKYVTPRETR